MRHVIPALLAAAAITSAPAAPAAAATSVGVSMGAAQLDPANPTRFDSYHTASGFRFRWDALSPYTEMMFGLVSRTQALDATKRYVFDTSGLSLSAGAHVGFLRAGVGLEAAWLRQIIQDPATPGMLRFHNGGGFLVEPYVGVVLPFLQSDVTELELSVHYPLPQLRPDPALGPRAMLTLWLGADAANDDDDDDKDDDEEGKSETPMEEPAAEPSAEPTPAPAATPAPKPSAKPKPKPRPSTRKPKR